MPIQQVDRRAFGVGRLFQKVVGGALQKIADCNEIMTDLKIEQKEIYGEGGYALAVADGHRSVDITAKHWTLNLASIATDFNAPAPTTATDAPVFDEAHVVATVTFDFTLTHGATLIPGTEDVVVFVSDGQGGFYPVTYAIVTPGSEAAGVSCSCTNVGHVVFAAGDVGLAVLVTYEYTLGSPAGEMILITNTYQNSAAAYAMTIYKRDKSPIDGSVGILKASFYAVRPGGTKVPFKENDWSSYDRTWKAFADPTGNVVRFRFLNS